MAALCVDRETKLRFLEAIQILSGNEPLMDRVKMAGCLLESVWPEDLPGPLWYDLKKTLIGLQNPKFSEDQAEVFKNQWFKIFRELV